MRIPYCVSIALLFWTAADVRANDAAAIPVREVTVFKDGHAFILHEGQMPTDPDGNVLLDALPEPVMGTFWPYSGDRSARLVSVVAGRRSRTVSRDALTLSELLQINVGKQVLVTEGGGPSYQAVILDVPSKTAGSGEEADSGAQPGEIILFKTEDGTRAVDLSRIRDVTFLDEAETSWTHQESRNRLQLKLDWKGRSPDSTAQVGMVYLQKGIRWIPGYQVVLADDGKAHIRLQATLINEITDLEDVTAHLVIGVPSFAFQGTLDPIALQETAAQLSRYFRSEQRTAYAFSNAIMSQTASPVEPSAGESGVADWEGQAAGSAKNEDLYVFTVQHISLKKDDRMVVPIVEFDLEYEDVFTLDLPFAPPPDVRRSLGDSREAELARRLAKPVVRHNVRLTNDSPYPLTTAPALVLRDNRLLAQGMMSYTAVGGACDLGVGDAVDIQITKEESETRRIPNAVRWRNNDYARVDLEGKLRLTNRRGTPARLEVTRWVLGNVDSADSAGQVTNVNLFEDSSFLPSGGYPFWWGWYNWPDWWRHFNGVSRIVWKFELEDQERAELGYSWHYFWR